MTAQRKKAKNDTTQQSAAIAQHASSAAASKSARKTAPKSKAGSKAGSKPVAKVKTASATKGNRKKLAAPARSVSSSEEAQVLESQIAFDGPLFRVFRDRIIEPGGRESKRDVIRHNGSIVILAVDPGKRKKAPWIVVERQYRYAAGQCLWELPAGKLEVGEEPLEGARRELAEETGYGARKWSPLIDYYASPGFLGESMKIFLAEGLIPGDAHPEADEEIDFRLVRLSELLALIDKGGIKDGKTLVTILLYARRLGVKKKT
jgi:ADP-ribose pyrophosphatase